ncbi:MAG: hypothetical protein JSW61_09815 [Candidatus Thorarchaeota archaeon]|nr:MAG: hypothetical protein JSW61_09815 [Candidatus Thorarchaeota archaeon]
MNQEINTKQSPAFLKIRLAALEKAFNQVRNMRILLDEKLDRGHLSQEDYSRSINVLVAEGVQIRAEQARIESALGIS